VSKLSAVSDQPTVTRRHPLDVEPLGDNFTKKELCQFANQKSTLNAVRWQLKYFYPQATFFFETVFTFQTTTSHDERKIVRERLHARQ
jgi:hypothetical protein